MAHAFIDAAAKCGAHGIKFQTHIAAAESTPEEPWRVKFSTQDKSRYEYWQRMEFTEDQWMELKKHADDKKLLFISSPFSIEAVKMLQRVGTAVWKIASGEILNTPMLEEMAKAKLPFWISTGMSDMKEIDKAVEIIRSLGAEIMLFQCTSMYPTPPEWLGLNMLSVFRDKYNCEVGLSDHSGNIYAGLGAAALGVSVIEVHFALSKEMFGPDVPVSLTPAELTQLVEGSKFLSAAVQNPVDKDKAAEKLQDMRKLFNKSISAKEDIPEGTVISKDHLAYKKPGTGIPASRFNEIIGRKTTRRIAAGSMLAESDFV
jgi:N-acetylneuraminate synthase